MKTITIFTPTYNRSYCLHQVYESLCVQSSKDFEWLIIDDGSSDGTEKLVADWINEDQIVIKYVYKENGGMHTGHNLAHQIIETELNVCIDSDDYMPYDAVEKIIKLWKKYGSEKYAGMVGLDADFNGNIIGVKFPEDLKVCSYSELKPKYGVTGDKKSIYRTDILKKYKEYPEFENEKFVPLYLPIIVDSDYQVLCFNEVFCHVEYQLDGSTLNIYRQYFENPNGFLHYRRILMEKSGFFRVKVTNAIHYVSTKLILGNYNVLKGSPEKLITFFVVPFGVLLFLYLKIKTRI
jgi:glycosyltransferase involved in cell wall biosynthesis